MGRLNNGSFNKGAWCASKQDTRQYLQVSKILRVDISVVYSLH